jgi:hypothetical protein
MLVGVLDALEPLEPPLPPLPPLLPLELLAPPPPQAAIERLARNNAGRIRERKKFFMVSEVLFNRCGESDNRWRPLRSGEAPTWRRAK